MRPSARTWPRTLIQPRTRRFLGTSTIPGRRLPRSCEPKSTCRYDSSSAAALLRRSMRPFFHEVAKLVGCILDKDGNRGGNLLTAREYDVKIGTLAPILRQHVDQTARTEMRCDQRVWQQGNPETRQATREQYSRGVGAESTADFDLPVAGRPPQYPFHRTRPSGGGQAIVPAQLFQRLGGAAQSQVSRGGNQLEGLRHQLAEHGLLIGRTAAKRDIDGLVDQIRPGVIQYKIQSHLGVQGEETRHPLDLEKF